MNHLTPAWMQWTSILSKSNCYPSIALDSLEHKANTNNVFSSCACSKWLPFPGETSVVKIVQQEYFLTESPSWPIPQKSQLEETWEGCPTVHYPGMRPDCSTREGQAQKKTEKSEKFNFWLTCKLEISKQVFWTKMLLCIFWSPSSRWQKSSTQLHGTLKTFKLCRWQSYILVRDS